MGNSVNLIIKPVGNMCNLNCSYCYTHQACVVNEHINVEEIFDLINKISKETRIQKVKFTWHGGEPFLWGTDNYRKVFEKQREKLKNLNYMNIFQTNGTLINEEYIQLIKDYNASIGISIDGPTYELNKLRFSSEDKFQELINNIYLLKQNNVEFALFCTITENNIEKVDEILAFIEQIQPYAYTLIPIISSVSRVSRNRWKEILQKTNDFYIRTGIVNSYTMNLNSLRPRMCMLNGRCQSFVTIDHKGNINKTCQINPELYIGNIADKDIMDKIVEYTQKALEVSQHSIFSYLNERKYIYFQGDGCYYRKRAGSNDEFISGIVDYLKER